MISNIFWKTQLFYILGTSPSSYPWEKSIRMSGKLKNYFKKIKFCVQFLKRIIFLTFRMDLILRTGFRWNFERIYFCESYFSIFWFFVVCSTAASMWVTELRTKFFNISNSIIFRPRFFDISNSIIFRPRFFDIPLFGYKRLNSRRSKGEDIIKRFAFSFLCCL